MAKYKVRDGFWVHGVTEEPIGPGEVIELDDEQAAAHAVQVEPVVTGKKKADGAAE